MSVMTEHEVNVLRQLPAVAAVLATAEAVALLDRHGRAVTTDAIRQVIDEAREVWRVAPVAAPSAADLALRAGELLAARMPGLR
ncbi:MAG: L-seryl-tRNA(Sec) selenium transferase, partial [Dyella sp.]|nr:L-seryl-tRNA(Sec) selenium transferase [Dyella sp.]